MYIHYKEFETLKLTFDDRSTDLLSEDDSVYASALDLSEASELVFGRINS